jgi:predicted lipoprotein with Yx(FWY)xxD motif
MSQVISTTNLGVATLRSGAARWVGAVCLALLAATLYHWLGNPRVIVEANPQVLLTTPRGITLQLRTVSGPRSDTVSRQLVYANALGMTLYLLDPGVRPKPAVCTGDCAAQWTPAIAPPEASPGRDWSLKINADGTRQWTFRGAALYRFAGDKQIGDTKGDGVDGRHAAVFQPGAGMQLPDAVNAEENADANGVVLVDSRGMTLYVRDSDATPSLRSCENRDDCAPHFAPLMAPEVAIPTGDFSTTARDDGITQWAYRGGSLYTFDGDRRPGDANGIWANAGFRAALITNHFMPANVMIHPSVELGTILATTSGLTLYIRDRPMLNSNHIFRESRGAPELGRALGTASCDEDCTKTWLPLIAPADALPTGYWDIATRSDGRRQWVYKGYALYTYSLDQPGDTRGNDHYDLVQISDGSRAASDSRKPIDEGAAAAVAAFVPYGPTDGIGPGVMNWHAVVP